jgi:type I restriction enzyme, S subunit
MEGWQVKPLGDVCEFQRGLTYGKSDEVDVSSNVVLRANNVDLATHTLDLSELRYISDSIPVPAGKKLRKGSLLICTASGSKSHLGKVAYVDEDYGYAFGGFMGQLTPVPGLDGRYLFHALTSPAYKDFIEALSDGVNINNLKFDDLRQFPVSVPPVPEQRRIVAVLDEAFESITTAKANAEKNLQNSRRLLKHYLAMVFATPDSRWETRALGDAVRFIDYRGKTPPKRDEGIRLITAKNVKMGFIQKDPEEFIDPSVYDGWMTRGLPRRGDVLFTTEAPLGNVAQLDTDETVVVGQRLITMQPLDTSLDRGFLKYALMSPAVQASIQAKGTGATVLGIKASLLRTVPIWYPREVEEQTRLVELMSAVEDGADALCSISTQKLLALDLLKKSLLHQAFTGALTVKSTNRQVAEVA